MDVSQHDGDALHALISQFSRPTGFVEPDGLARMRNLMTLLGEPQTASPVIHVGGTAGKGSTARMIAAILAGAGLSVGLFTKPHFESVSERMLINGRPVDSADLARLLNDHANAWSAANATWFEVSTALAFLVFRRAAVDVSVVEVGMGGIDDATNVVSPTVSVITNVGLDHVAQLGGTLEAIATAKAGIIKSEAPCVTGVANGAPRRILARRADEAGVPIFYIGEDFTAASQRAIDGGVAFDYTSSYGDRHDVRLPVIGGHQVTNAAVAIRAIEAMNTLGYHIPESAIRMGLSQVQLPGRFEVSAVHSGVIVDVAHSVPKFHALVDTLDSMRPSAARVIVVLALAHGREPKEVLPAILGAADEIIFTKSRARNEYGAAETIEPNVLLDTARRLLPGVRMSVVTDVAEAFATGLNRQGHDDLLLITGSFTIARDARRYFDYVLDETDGKA